MKSRKIDIEKLNKRNIYQVPDDYFKDLPMKIQAKVQIEQSSRSILTKMQWMPQMLGVAAVVVLAFFWFQYRSDNQVDTTSLLAEVSDDTIIEYLANEDVSYYQLSSQFDTDEFNYSPNEIYLNTIDEELSNDELESIYSELDFTIDVL